MLNKKKTFYSKILIFILLFGGFLVLSFSFAPQLLAEENNEEILKEEIQKEIDRLDLEIGKKQKEIEDLNKQKEIYQKNIETKRKEIISLNNQLAIIENKQVQISLNIQSTEIEIEKNNLEIKNIELQIEQKEKEIQSQKEILGETVRLFYLSDQKTLLEVLLTNNSLADFFNQIKYSEDLQKSLQKTINSIEIIKQGLIAQREELNDKKENLEELKLSLETEKEKLKQEEITKASILRQTRGVEQTFQVLLSEVQREWNQIQMTIASLEVKVRDRLYQQKELGGKLWTGGKLSWPITGRVITSPFHDPDYPFRSWIGEHSGIDLRSPQGSPVYSTAPGYVAIARDAGMGYNYIMIVHNENISTVYGHLSQILVQADSFVTRGQVIGKSGGMPGTPGAGNFSTGPHLHFEVRLNGIPVNPLEYL